MDKLQDYEIESILNNLPYTDINDWEQCRTLVYIISQLFSKTKSDIKDIMHFPWDDTEESKEDNTSISQEDIDMLQKMSAEISSKYFNK